MRYDAVVFDLDGTLSQSDPGIIFSVRYALETMNRPIPPTETLMKFIGPPLIDSFMRYCGMTHAQAQEALAAYRRRHLRIGWMEVNIYPGIFQLLRSLKHNGVYVALASAKPLPLCQKTLDYYGLSPFFDKLSAPSYANESADKRDLIVSALPDRYTRACMVGDRLYDIQGAKDAGVRAVGVGYGYGSEAELTGAGADVYVESVEALRRELLGDAPEAPGTFITFEGTDGCGKSTQFGRLEQWLKRCGVRTAVTREPGGCPISERIRALVLDVKAVGMSDECEALLFAASRVQHVKDVILPALARGDVVLCDRYVDSSIAYQGSGRRLGEAFIRQINAPAMSLAMPDMTLFFDIDPRVALSRRKAASTPDRIEGEQQAFMMNAYDSFQAMCRAEPERCIRIDANGEIEQIAGRVRQNVMNRMCPGGYRFHELGEPDVSGEKPEGI